jgi:hypothetical protein
MRSTDKGDVLDYAEGAIKVDALGGAGGSAETVHWLKQTSING